jgi:hypothetical protein
MLTPIFRQRSRVPIRSWQGTTPFPSHPASDGDSGPIPHSIILGTGTTFSNHGYEMLKCRLGIYSTEALVVRELPFSINCFTAARLINHFSLQRFAR